MATVTTSIGHGTTHDQNVNINSSSGAGPSYSVTLAAAGSNVVNGDALWDEHATPRKYLITAGAGTTSLTVEDHEGVGSAPDSSGTSTAQVKRYYNGSTPLSDWETDLDDSNVYANSDDAVGEAYNDATFTESSVTFNGGGSITLTSWTLKPADGEGHTGVAGTGVKYTGGMFSPQGASGVQHILEGWELEPSSGQTICIDNSNPGSVVVHIRRNIVHDNTSGGTGTNAGIYGGSGSTGASDDTCICNNIVYDLEQNGGGSREMRGIQGCDGGRDTFIYNNTVYSITGNGSGGNHGIFYDDDDDIQNNISMGADDNDFNDDGLGTEDYNMSSDTTATGSNSLISKTAANQFSNVVDGSEDFHLLNTSEALGEANDLDTTPTNVNIDIDGRDRDELGVDWDMGADQYVEIITSIAAGTAHDTNVTINSVAADGAAYSVTLASVPGDTVVGDRLLDEGGNAYLIMKIDGSVLTVYDSENIGAAPDDTSGGQAKIGRYYTGSTPLTSWEADLTDTHFYRDNDIVRGQVYNDGTNLDENLAISISGAAALGDIYLETPSGERHTGVAGTGARIVKTSGTSSKIIDVSSSYIREYFIDGLEISGGGSYGSIGIELSENGRARWNIVHGLYATGSSVFGINHKASTAKSLNNFIYDLECAESGNDGCLGLRNVSGNARAYNNSVYYIRNNNGSGLARGIATEYAYNNIVCDAGGTTSGTKADYGDVGEGHATNASSDSSAPSPIATNPVVAATEFSNTVGGSEDLHLKSGAECIGAGTDYGTDPDGVELDIDGRDRDDEGDTWDVGADQFVGVAATPLATTLLMPVESLLVLVPDYSIPVEVQATTVPFQPGITKFPIETLLTLVTDDSISIDNTTMISPSTKMSVESLLTLIPSYKSPVNYLGIASEAYKSPIETLLIIAAHPSMPTEIRATTIFQPGIHKLPLETLLTLVPSYKIPIEILIQTEIPIGDEAGFLYKFPIETLLTIASNPKIPVELLGQEIIQTTQNFPLETLLILNPAKKTPAEILGIMQGTGQKIPVEYLTGDINNAFKLPIESLLTLAHHPSMPVEIRGGTLVTLAPKLPIESLLTLFPSYKAPMESILSIAPVAPSTPIESLGGGILTSPSMPIETLGAGIITIVKNLPIETLVYLSIDKKTPVESILQLSPASHKIPISTLIALDEVFTYKSPIEILQGLLDNNKIPVEIRETVTAVIVIDWILNQRDTDWTLSDRALDWILNRR